MYKTKYSPWGKIQTYDRITPWLWNVSTSSHGGLKVDREHNAMIPKQYRRKGGWYEEDCEYAIPLYYLFEMIEKEKEDEHWLKLDKEKLRLSIGEWF